MQRIGQSWLVLKLTDSGTALGIVVALQYLPVLIISPLGGVLADRFIKRKVLYLTQSVSLALALILGFLVVTNHAELWMVYVLAAMLGIADSIDAPTRHSFIHEMVGGELLKNAVTLNSVMANLAKIIGPALAGLVIAGMGIAPCFFLNAASYLGVLVCLYLMRGHELNTVEPVKEIKGQVVRGLHYVANTPPIRNVLIIVAIVGMFSYEFQVSLPLMAKFAFHSDARGYAFLMSSMGVGAILGGLATAGRKRLGPSRLVWPLMAFGLALFLTAISPNLIFAGFMMVLVGFFSITFTALANTTIQLESDPNMRGRVMALWTVAFLGTTPIGGPIVGWVGEHIAARGSLIVGMLAALLAGIYGILVFKQKPACERSSVPTR